MDDNATHDEVIVSELLEHATVLSLRNGDVLVVRSDRPLSAQQVNEDCALIRRVIDRACDFYVPILFLGPEHTMGVIRSKPDA